MSWRAPQLQPGTLLTGRIHLGILDEDYTLWGPANLIYYPGNRDVVITAEVLDDKTLPLFLSGKTVLSERKGIEFEKDFGNLLVISKPENGCLHVIDGAHPEYSQGEDALLKQVGALSNIDQIDVDSLNVPTPRNDIFGSEPPHDWCYYYQKAQLARQQQNWHLVASLGEEVIKKGLYSNDPIEWLVFMQGFAYAREEFELKVDHYGQDPLIDQYYDIAYDYLSQDPNALRDACVAIHAYDHEMEDTKFQFGQMRLVSSYCTE
jgi:hypothetical protein